MGNLQSSQAMRAAVVLRKELDSLQRKFIATEQVRESYLKEYRYIEGGVGLLRFACDSMGSVSDCFILYAFAVLGIADRMAVSMFLKSMARKYKELNIVSLDDPDLLRRRIQSLFKCGFLFKMKYCVNTMGDESSADNINLWSITKDGLSLMNSKLGKRVIVDQWLQGKCIQDIVAWSSASYISTILAQNNNFSGYGERIFKAPSTGTTYVPNEVLFDGPEKPRQYSVAFVQGYFNMNKQTQTVDDFKDACSYKIKTIRNFLDVRGRKYNTYVVCVVESSKDLTNVVDVMFGSNILRDFVKNSDGTVTEVSGAFEDYISRIYFTGEGIALEHKGELDSGLLKLVLDESTGSYVFTCEVPPFLRDFN